jgi:hypothetical protein
MIATRSSSGLPTHWMHMFIYVGKNFTATVHGQQLKNVTCEKCRADYYYVLSRVATGSGTAPYYIGQGAAQRRAEKSAQKSLQKRLMREAEAVPCPHCKWINHELMESYRRTQYTGFPVFAAVVFIVGAGAAAIAYAARGHNDPDIPPIAIAIGVVTILLTIALFALPWFLRRRINLNHSVDGVPKVPVGTPPALIKGRDPETGADALIPVPSDLSNLQSDAQWATFRHGELDLPPLCCECLEPPTTSYHLPMPANKEFIPVPLCHPCLRKIQKQWWLRNFLGMLGAFAIAGLLSLLVPKIDDTGRIMITIMGGGFLTLISFFLIDGMLRPYRLTTADNTRNIYKIRFKNPAYTALLIRNLGQRDGLY